MNLSLIYKISPILAIIFLCACTSDYNKKSVSSALKPSIQYKKDNSKLISVHTLASSNNECIDNFNFLKQAQDKKYNDYSRAYIEIGEGFNFLNSNKNIMNKDAKRVYTMRLEMKLDTLCSEVSYTGYNVIKQRIKDLNGI
jgi:hypothetical protein